MTDAARADGFCPISGDPTRKSDDVRARTRLSVRPGVELLRRLLRRPSREILGEAKDVWTVGEATELYIRPAKFLDGQLGRMKGTVFGEPGQVHRDFLGGFSSLQPPSMGYRLTDVTLLDGILYGAASLRHLKARTSLAPANLLPKQSIRGSMYESWPGNRWFGNWLLNDLLTYRLAEAAGQPFTTNPLIGHMKDYEARLGMKPIRLSRAHFDELILFDDQGANRSRVDRAQAIGRALTGPACKSHPGVFILRGTAGDRRLLHNERDIAEHLVRTRGFTVIDPMSSDLDSVLRACAGAQVVAGVEGSHLVHGLMVMAPGASALVIQPPERACSVLKLVTDRLGCDFAFVVGVGTNEAFHASITEIERTLDLL